MKMRQHRKARHTGMQHHVARTKAGHGGTPWQRHCMVIHSDMSLKQVRRNYYQPAYASVRAAVTLDKLMKMHRQCIVRGNMAHIYGKSRLSLRSRPVRTALIDEADDFYDAAMGQAFEESTAMSKAWDERNAK